MGPTLFKTARPKLLRTPNDYLFVNFHGNQLTRQGSGKFETAGQIGGDQEKCDTAHVATFICDPYFRKWS